MRSAESLGQSELHLEQSASKVSMSVGVSGGSGGDGEEVLHHDGGAEHNPGGRRGCAESLLQDGDFLRPRRSVSDAPRVGGPCPTAGAASPRAPEML